MRSDRSQFRASRRLRWIARILGTLVAGFWLVIGILSGLGEPKPWEPESLIMAGLMIASAMAVGTAWWRERRGGILVIACGVAHMVFALIASGHNHGFAMLISGGPYLLVGILFLLSDWTAQKSGATDTESSEYSRSGSTDG